MTETQRRIQELKAALPNVKEKVVAVAVLLAMSIAMMASVSYAWYTLSLAPELGGVTTTVSSNGSLEVALAGLYDEDGDLIEPLASAVGDSFSAEDQTTVAANLTWGNLINLSNNYGIEELVLRPATFDAYADAYLSSMEYGDDGRVSGSTNKFDFTYWTKNTDGSYEFLTSAAVAYGVRAISSVTYPETEVESKLSPADTYFSYARNGYTSVINNTDYITTIEGLVQSYLDANVSAFLGSATGGSSEVDTDCTIYKDDLYRMLDDLYVNAFQNYGEALAAMANAQMALRTNQYVPYTWDKLYAATDSELTTNGVDLGSSLSKFKTEYAKLKADVVAMKTLTAQATVMWSDIEGIVDDLISISTVEIMVDTSGNVLTENGYTVSEILGLGADNILAYASTLNDQNEVPIRVYKGIMYEFERVSGIHMYVSLTAKIRQSFMTLATVRGKLYTSARVIGEQAAYYDDRETTLEIAEEVSSGNVEFAGQKEALETYGMVVDLWVRTNAANSILTLDGLVETVEYEALLKLIPSGEAKSKQAYNYTYNTGNETLVGTAETADIQMFLIYIDLNGNEKIDEYTYDVQLKQDDKTVTETVTVYEGYFYDTTTYAQVYLRDENGDPVYAKDGDGNIIPETDANGNQIYDEDGNPVYVYEYLTSDHFINEEADIQVATYTYDVVTGFSASNRVDDGYSTEAELIKELSATQGSGSCYIFYADSPEQADSALELLSHLQLAFCDASGSLLAKAKMDVDRVYSESGKYTVPLVITEGYSLGDGTYGITTLVQNEATLISVVVYLDGNGLDNSMVMSKESVQGNLNLQFASSADLDAMDNMDMSLQTVKLSASIDKAEMDFDADDLGSTTTTLKATIEGLSPSMVQAVFRRQINASQGTLMEAVTLSPTSTGYAADVTFKAPGTYVLRSLWIDGVEYKLPQEQWITVVVNGFNVRSVSFCEAKGENLALTADSYVTRSIMLDFADGDQPESVAVRFLSDSGKYVSANLTYDSGTKLYKGDVKFTSSDHYTLTYVVLDDEYYELDDAFRKEFTAYLGLRTRVYLQSDVGLNFPFQGPQEVTVLAEILTDSDEALKNLENVKLYYNKRGNSDFASGVNGNLTWNGSYYVGKFNVTRVGVFNFAQMMVGTNVITQATDAPTITAYSTTPPSYASSKLYFAGTDTESTDLLIMSDAAEGATDTNAYYVVTLNDASGVDSVGAVFTDPSTSNWSTVVTVDASEEHGYFVENDDGTTSVYIKIPDKANGSKGGKWVVTDIQITGVYDEDGNFYGEGEDAHAAHYDVKANYAFTVLASFDVTVDTLNLGSTTDPTYHFMYSHDLSDLNYGVTIKNDSADAMGLTVMNVVLKLTHNGDSKANGGYVPNSTVSNITYTLIQNAEGKWVVPADTTIELAGTYNYTLTYNLVGDNFPTQSYTKTGKNTITVKSVTPSVTVTDVTPSANVPTKITYELVYEANIFGNVRHNYYKYNLTDNYTYSLSDNEVYVHAEAKENPNGGSGDAGFVRPTLTFTVAGIDDLSTVTFTIPAGDALAIDFSQKGNGTSSAITLGKTVLHENLSGKYYNMSMTCTIDKYLGHGDQEIETVTVTRGGVAYTVYLETSIKIHNPSSTPTKS